MFKCKVITAHEEELEDEINKFFDENEVRIEEIISVTQTPNKYVNNDGWEKNKITVTIIYE